MGDPSGIGPEIILKSFEKLDEFLSGSWLLIHEYPFDDPEFSKLVDELVRLATDLKTKIAN